MGQRPDLNETSGASHDDFVNDLTGDEKASQCRYGLCDFRYVSDGTDGMDVGMNVSKRVLIVWKPDTAKIKEKMLYQGKLPDSNANIFLPTAKISHTTDVHLFPAFINDLASYRNTGTTKKS